VTDGLQDEFVAVPPVIVKPSSRVAGPAPRACTSLRVEGGAPVVRACAIVANRADQGGGLLVTGSSALVLEGCRLEGNAATVVHGGAIYNDGADPLVVNVVLRRNTAANGGGALFDFNGSEAVILNSSFVGNEAGNGGGAVYALLNARPRLVNCTLVANTATGAGGGVRSTSGSAPMLVNCILWANADAGGAGSEAQVSVGTGVPAVHHCCVQGGWAGGGGGNIDDDPLFTDPDGPDDDPATLEDNDYRLAIGSPCADAGNNWLVVADRLDLDGDGDVDELTPLDCDMSPRFADEPGGAGAGCGGPVVVDLGAFETVGPSANPVMPSDIDGSGAVDVADLLEVLGDWGPCDETCCDADLDVDGDIAVGDLLQVLADWS
jgi:hypothetical protein